MPKMKSHSGAKKRFFVTKRGKIKHKKAGQRHLLTGMSSNRGRNLKHSAILNTKDTHNLKKYLPYD